MQRSVLFKGGVTKAAALLLGVSCMPDATGGVIRFSGAIVVATYEVSAPATLPAVAASARNGWTPIGVTGDARTSPQVTARVGAVGRSELVVRCTDGRSGAGAPVAGQGCRVGPDGRGLEIRPTATMSQDTRPAAIVTLIYD